MQGCCSRVQLSVTLWTVACQASLSGGFSRQKYWSVLANTGCHTLLEHCISCCPSRQLTWCCQNPCDPSSCSTPTPGPHRGKPKSSRAATGANPSGRPGGSVPKEEDPTPPHELCKLQVKSGLCVYGIYKGSLRAPTRESALVLIALDTGGKNTQEEEIGRAHV